MCPLLGTRESRGYGCPFVGCSTSCRYSLCAGNGRHVFARFSLRRCAGPGPSTRPLEPPPLPPPRPRAKKWTANDSKWPTPRHPLHPTPPHTHTKPSQWLLGRGTSPPTWDGRLGALGQRRRRLPSSTLTRQREVKHGKSGGSVGTTGQGNAKAKSGLCGLRRERPTEGKGKGREKVRVGTKRKVKGW